MIDIKDLFLKIKVSLLSLDFKRIFNVPNILTLLRIWLIVPFSLNLLNENYVKAFEILIFSGVTDFLDGMFARMLNQQTKIGEILDPIADKLTLISIMICLSIKFGSILGFMVVLIIKELCMLFAGAFMLKKVKKTIKSRWYGKLATAFFYFSISLIVFFKAMWEIESKFLVNILMSLTSLLMIYALIKYLLEFLSMIHVRKHKDN